MWIVKDLFGHVLGVIPLAKKQLIYLIVLMLKGKSCESRFHNNLDPLQEYFDELEWDPLLPATCHDIPDGEYVQCHIVINAKAD